jgi:hypothetical protein
VTYFRMKDGSLVNPRQRDPVPQWKDVVRGWICRPGHFCYVENDVCPCQLTPTDHNPGDEDRL